MYRRHVRDRRVEDLHEGGQDDHASDDPRIDAGRLMPDRRYGTMIRSPGPTFFQNAISAVNGSSIEL
jgi:hypothetical protein